MTAAIDVGHHLLWLRSASSTTPWAKGCIFPLVFEGLADGNEQRYGDNENKPIFLLFFLFMANETTFIFSDFQPALRRETDG